MNLITHLRKICFMKIVKELWIIYNVKEACEMSCNELMVRTTMVIERGQKVVKLKDDDSSYIGFVQIIVRGNFK